jgi:hypothetical protein
MDKPPGFYPGGVCYPLDINSFASYIQNSTLLEVPMAKIYDLAEEREKRRGSHAKRLTITDSVTQTPPYWLNPAADAKFHFPADWNPEYPSVDAPTSL